MLLNLPSELLWTIWDHLDSPSSQNALIQTCHLLHTTFNNTLYKNLLKPENTTECKKALCWSAQNNRPVCVQTLLSHGTPSGPTDSCTVDLDNRYLLPPRRPYHMLSPSNHLDRENKAYWTEYTPLVCAVQKGHTEIVKILLDAGANPNSRGNAHDLPVMAAVRGRYSEIVRLLLEAGAHGIGIGIRQWESLLAYACDDGDVQTVEALLQAPAAAAARRAEEEEEATGRKREVREGETEDEEEQGVRLRMLAQVRRALEYAIRAGNAGVVRSVVRAAIMNLGRVAGDFPDFSLSILVNDLEGLRRVAEERGSSSREMVELVDELGAEVPPAGDDG